MALKDFFKGQIVDCFQLTGFLHAMTASFHFVKVLG
jgi:hypothetical protein